MSVDGDLISTLNPVCQSSYLAGTTNLNHPLIAYSNGNLGSLTFITCLGSVGVFVTSFSTNAYVTASGPLILGSAPWDFNNS